MSDALGPMVYAENENEVFLGRSVTQTKHVSEETMRKVDAEVRRIIDEQYAIARKLIEENQDKMHKMAKALLEWETIDAAQIDDIMDGKDPRPPKQLHKKAAKKDDDVIEAEATEIKEPASEASSETVSETPAASGAGEEKKSEASDAPKSAIEELADDDKKDQPNK